MTDTSLPATTDVYLNTSLVVGNGYGTKIDLANSGTNFVNGLFIDGIAQAQGTWGASGSGATNINDTFFKGNSTITVGPGPAPVNFAISSLSVADGMVTLTWNSRENVTYIIRYSLDLANWAADLEDKIEPGPEGETTRTYDLSEYGLDTETKWFLRVEEESHYTMKI